MHTGILAFVPDYDFAVQVKHLNTRVSQKFCNILVVRGHNSVIPAAFTVVLKITDHIEMWDVELTWYSPNATRRICLWLGAQPQNIRLGLLDLAKPSGYSIVITFCLTNVFWVAFRALWPILNMQKNELPNWSRRPGFNPR